MSTNLNQPNTNLSDASFALKGVVGLLLVAAMGLVLSTDVARASNHGSALPYCEMRELPLTVFESGFTSFGQLCDEMKSHGFWGAWGG